MEPSDLHVSGRLQVPGDKSISHRALMFGALGTGRSRVRGVLQSADVGATAACLRAMGWDIPPLDADFTITGGGLQPLRQQAVASLPCGNSGTTARLMAGIAAAQRLTSEFDGDASLRRRPMRRVSEPLHDMGARFEWLHDQGCLPMRVTGGTLRELHRVMDVPSAQVKSALLLAGCCAGVPVSIVEPMATRDHTERMLRAAGVRVDTVDQAIALYPPAHLNALDTIVPGDPSSAAFFAGLAAGAAHGQLTLTSVLLNPHRTGFLSVLRRMGARIQVLNERLSGGEPVGDLLVLAGPLTGTAIAPGEVPSLIDEIPLLAALGAVAEGELRVTGASELRVKESDRIATTVANLRAAGVNADELPDGLVVQGGAAVRSASVVTHGDHRIAMAFAVLGALTNRDLRIDDPDCVSVSFPTFWTDLARVTR